MDAIALLAPIVAAAAACFGASAWLLLGDRADRRHACVCAGCGAEVSGPTERTTDNRPLCDGCADDTDLAEGSYSPDGCDRTDETADFHD